MRKYAVLALIVILALMMSGCALFSPAPPTKAILEGRVVVPQRAVRQVGGQPLAGATVRVKDLEGNIVATTTTDANGYYRVEVPAGGPYIIEVVKGSIKVLCVSPQVEVGETYDLGTADATSTAVALVFQAKVEAGEDPAEIDPEEIKKDPKFGNLAQAVEEALAAGEDPTTAPEVIHLVDIIVSPPAPAPEPKPEPTPTYTVTFTITPEEAADATVVVQDSKGNVVTTTTPGVYKLTPGAYTYTVSKTGYVAQTGKFTVVDKDLTITVTLNPTPDTTPPTLKSLTAYLDSNGTREAKIVDGKWTLEWTVGEKVDHIEAIASEPVKLVVENAVVTMSGEGKALGEADYTTIPEDTVYGTIRVDETDFKKLIIEPYEGNKTAGLVGGFTFTVAEGVVEDDAGNKNEETKITLMVKAPVYNDTKKTYYLTLTAAMDAVESGDTIVLGRWTFDEELEINWSVTITGIEYFITDDGYVYHPDHDYIW